MDTKLADGDRRRASENLLRARHHSIPSRASSRPPTFRFESEAELSTDAVIATETEGNATDLTVQVIDSDVRIHAAEVLVELERWDSTSCDDTVLNAQLRRR